MPLTKAGRKTLRRFKQEYGPRGESVFYAYMRKHPHETYKMHKAYKHLTVGKYAKHHLSLKKHRLGTLDRKLKKMAMHGY